MDVFASAPIKESHGSLHICEFPVSVLRANIATVDTETNQVVSECTVEGDGKHAREQYQQDAQFFLLIYFNQIILNMFRTNTRNCSTSHSCYRAS